MKTMRFIAAILICITVQYDIIFGADQTSTRPDLTMYIDYYNSKVTCVAGTNTSGDAVALLAPLSNINGYQVCKYIYPIAMTESECNFENNNCNSWKTDGLEIIKSGLHNFLPITDERWNLFRQFRTTGPKTPEYSEKYAINTKDFHISVSVRSTRDVHFLLCDAALYFSTPNDEKCYWIMIDAFDKEANKITAIRKCVKGVPKDYPRNDPECSERRKQIMLDEQLFKEMEWRHFTIIRENGNILKLFELNDPTTPLFEYEDSSPINIKQLLFRGYNKAIAEWKIHDYSFLSITKPNKQLKIGPTINGDTNELCLSLYVALCPQCEIKIKISSDNGDTTEAEIKVQGEEGIMVPWRNIKIRAKTYPSSIYYLYAFASNKQNAVNPFWAIDDVRRCHTNEIRTVSSTVSNINNAGVACQSLVYRHWIVEETNTNDADERLQCSDPLFTGSSCNITCQSLFQDIFCEFRKVCRPASRNEQICICSRGVTGSTCSDACIIGRYGYNCENECGQCKYGNNCDKFTGNCPQGCINDYAPPKCLLTILPLLLHPPTVIQISHTSVILQLTNIEVSGLKEPLNYQIEFKEIARAHWQAFDLLKVLELNSEIEVTGLTAETSYLVRAVVYTDTNESYKEDNIPTIEFNTTCIVERSIDIHPSSRNVNITLQGNEESCKIQNYYGIITDNGERVYDSGFGNSFIYVNTLKPYTHYLVTVGYSKHPQYNNTKYFNTLEDAPEKIENLHLEVASTNSLLLTWEPPIVANGEIKHYIVSYEKTKYISCFETTTDYISYETVMPSDSLRVLLENLITYSQYRVTVLAVTVSNGTEITQLFSTNQTAEARDEELPNEVKVDPGETSISVSWELPLCSHIQGPLFYVITINCLETTWCPNTTLTYVPVESSIRNIKISDLIPWTKYSIEFRASRSKSISVTTKSTSLNFQTKISAPPAVRNLTVFSKTENSISIRWMAPCPPHGELEIYLLRQCYNSYHFNCNFGKYAVIIPQPCTLWDGFICYELINVYANYHYNIFITVKNKDVSKVGDVSKIATTAIQEKSEKPWNLTTEWKENKLVLYWNHPNITNGPLKRFHISLRQLDSEIIQEQKDNVYNYQLHISQPLQHYSYSFNKSIPYSSSYQVSIIGVNKYEGESETIIVNTPPETPELNAELSVNENEQTNTTITILIPGIISNTKSNASFLYVIVSNTNSKNIEKRNTNEISNKEEILEFSGSHGDAWIAVELEPSESELSFVVGDNSTIYSKHLDENLINKPLEPENSYGIIVILMNQYKNQKSYKAYQLDTIRTTATIISGQKALFALLLLFLIVPVIVWFVYRKSLSKTNRPRSIIPGLNLVRTDTHSEPDVIPLTQTSGDARPKGPAIARKPNLKNILVEAEINKTETTLFHSRLVLLNNLEQYIKEALENGELAEQHSLFPRGQTKPWEYGIIKANKSKNRYNNLIAYDHTRVKLEKINSDQYSDYINANYINGYKQGKAYIATQGPKVTTVNDFWRMIWQEKVEYIVMLANVIEGGKKKCEKYWPDIDTTEKHANIEVYFAKLEVYADYEFRTFEVKIKGEKRIVTQLHFTSWPDHGVPLYPQSLVPFLKKILTISQGNAPIVVHCSAGVGRTGTIILCDICLRMAAREGAIDVLRYLHEIREERANLVDNIDQYKLVHMVLLECLLAPNTTIPCNNEFSTAIENFIEAGGLQTQLNYLQKTAWQDKALNFSVTNAPDPVNNSKNRFQNIIPLVNKVYISRYPIDDENSDYINAVPVDGFRFKEQFIVTQSPMPATIKDFWRMIMEKEVKVIVSLNTIPLKDETCCIFWPTNNDELKPMTHLTITYQKLLSHDIYDIHCVILHNSADDITSTVQIVQFKKWSHTETVPNNIEDLVLLWEDAENMSRGNYPMVVTCYDGSTASGLFVALSFVIEKIKLEQQCDACLAVRVIRRNRNEFVTDKTQFECLYKAAVAYLRLFETYSNFQPVVNKSIKKDSEE